MNCPFVPLGEPDLRGRRKMHCIKCGGILPNPTAATAENIIGCLLPVELRPTPRTERCAHLGPELRREECPTCSGKVQVKVFACFVHSECTLAKVVGQLKDCKSCQDWQANTD